MTNILLPSATLLLLLFTTTIAAQTTVYDIDGRPILANTNYNILPVFRGRGGGLTMLPKNKTASCPLYVAQDFFEVSHGLPIKFLPVNKQRRVTVSTDLNFVFDAASTCVQSTTWKLTIDEETSRRYIATGGQVGNPGVHTVDNWFKIEKAGTGKFDYKLVFCPGVCNFCKVMCGDIGVFIQEDGTRLLGFSDTPLLVMFKKVTTKY